jgi:hypothetical protein
MSQLMVANSSSLSGDHEARRHLSSSEKGPGPNAAIMAKAPIKPRFLRKLMVWT